MFKIELLTFHPTWLLPVLVILALLLREDIFKCCRDLDVTSNQQGVQMSWLSLSDIILTE